MISFIKQFDDLADQFINAIAADMANPTIRENIKTYADQFASQLLGRDVNSPLIKPFWDNIYNTATEYLEQQASDFIKVAVSDPPESIDTTATFIKEEIGNKVDSYAEKLKRKLEESKQSNNKASM